MDAYTHTHTHTCIVEVYIIFHLESSNFVSNVSTVDRW